MSLTRKVAFNTGFQIIGKIITTGLSLVLIAALTRYLGVSGFGNYTTVFAYVSFAAVLADFGFFIIMVREISRKERGMEKIVNNTMTLRAVIGFIVFTLAFIIGLFIPQYSMTVKLGIGVIGFGWFWTTLNSTYVGVFQSQLEMYKSAISEVVGRVIIFIFVILFIKMQYSLVVILSAYTIGNIINFILSMILGHKHVKFRFAFDFDFWQKMFWKALPMGIVLVLGLIYFKIDTIMLSIMKSSEDVGIYGAPYKIIEVLQIIPGIFMGNVFPILTRYITQKDKRVEATLQKSFNFLSILALPIMAGTIILAYPIIRLVVGSEFITANTVGTFFGQPATSVLVLQMLIVVVGLSFIVVLFNNTVIALGKQKELVTAYIILVLVNIILNFLWIPKYSYMGATVSTIITEILVLILTVRIVYKYIDFKIKYIVLFKALISTIIMGLIIYFFPSQNLFIRIFIGIISYISLIFLTGAVNKDMILSLIKKEKNDENRN